MAPDVLTLAKEDGSRAEAILASYRERRTEHLRAARPFDWGARGLALLAVGAALLGLFHAINRDAAFAGMIVFNLAGALVAAVGRRRAGGYI